MNWYIVATIATYCLVGFLFAVPLSVVTAVLRNGWADLTAALINVVAVPANSLAGGFGKVAGRIEQAVPAGAFGPGSLRRVIYLITGALLFVIDLALATDRLAAVFDSTGTAFQLPFGLDALSGLAWTLTAAWFFETWLSLNGQAARPPWDELKPATQRLLEKAAKSLSLATIVAAVLFWVYGGLALLGLYVDALSILFTAMLGALLTIAAATAFHASIGAWATLGGVLLRVVEWLFLGLQQLFEVVVRLLDGLAALLLAAWDFLALSIGYPAWNGLAESNRGWGRIKPLRPAKPRPPIGVPAPSSARTPSPTSGIAPAKS